MSTIGFKWLDILEKEFDKAFVDLDLSLSDLEPDEPNFVFNFRQKLCILSSSFAQLTHKAQTVFQNSAKIEAELVNMRAELTESRGKREILENELHHLLLQLHSTQLSKKQDQNFIKPDVYVIKKKLDAEIQQKSPIRGLKDENEFKFNSNFVEPAHYKAQIAQLEFENSNLRNDILALTSDVFGAKLAAKYLDKELAGRIQQLQLLGREMRGEIRDKLWRQLESEILLQRHKTVVKACRRNSNKNNNNFIKGNFQNKTIEENFENLTIEENLGDIRNVLVKKNPDQGLGISITGGREHGVPILISELEPLGPAAQSGHLYIGDAILFVNDIDLRNSCHREAVEILQKQKGNCHLKVQFIAADESDNSLEEDGFNFRFFDETVCDNGSSDNLKKNEEILKTPTAPRTPESSTGSRSPKNHNKNITNQPIILTNNSKLTSNASINSENENLSSPMQTSTDFYIDSNYSNDNLSIISNDSEDLTSKTSKIDKKSNSNQQLSDFDSDRSDDFGYSYEQKKKFFGVKTLQSIFNSYAYSDISTTESELEEIEKYKKTHKTPDKSPLNVKNDISIAGNSKKPPPQFEENINTFLSSLFFEKEPLRNVGGGKNIRIGKGLRLCPSEEEKKEKLLARYVYNSNCLGVDGVGDPDFGTPV